MVMKQIELLHARGHWVQAFEHCRPGDCVAGGTQKWLPCVSFYTSAASS